jgi:RES domain
MIVFRQVDGRYPFLWADASQPAGRWHAAGEGPAHYFADTPDGAWAEFLRHEEITDAEDLRTIRRQLWAVEIDDSPAEEMTLSPDVLTGGPDTYAPCQDVARVARSTGARRLVAPSAALKPGGARGVRVDRGEPEGEPRDGLTIVIFEAPAHLTGWAACVDGHPAEYLLDRVRHYAATSQ